MVTLPNTPSSNTPSSNTASSDTAPFDGTADLCIVGAGLAGLTAAVVAARAGLRVTVLDSLGVVGGRARTDRVDGLLLNQGPHALYLDGAALREWRALGIDPAGGVPPLGGVGRAGGTVSSLPFGPTTALRTKLLSPGAKLAWLRFQAGLPKLADRAAADGHLDGVTVADWLAAISDRSDLRAMAEAVVRLATYASAPELMSAGAAVAQLRQALGGVRYLDGGWQAAAEQLAGAARSAGASVGIGHRVREVAPSAEGWVLRTDRGEVAAHQVLFAGLNPEAVERLAELPAGELRTAAGPPVRAACVDVELAEVPDPTFALDLDARFYYSVQAPIARLAPEGRCLLSLAHYRSVTDDDGGPRMEEPLLEFARQLGAGAPLRTRYLHSVVVANGLPLATRKGFAGRPGVDALAGRGAGLWLAGDWVGGEGLLADASVASAVTAARRVISAANRSRVAA